MAERFPIPLILKSQYNQAPFGETMRRAFLMLLLTMPALRALADAGDVGTTSANFLKIPPDARPAAMGEAATAISDDESALVYNPAGMAGSLQDMFSATHIEWFQGIHLEHLGGFAQLGPMGTLGAALTWLQVDSMPRTVRTGANNSDPINNFAEIGSFSPHDMELSFAYALPFNANNAWGARLNIIQQNIDANNGYGVGLDLGWRTTNIWDALDLGLTLRNLGSQISVGGTPADQPLELATGARYSFFSHRASIVGECLIPMDNSIEGSVGGEFWLAGLVALRAGYKMGYLNQYTAGAGVKVADLVLDYAWVPYGDLGNTQRITASLAFGSPTIGLEASRPLIGPLGWPAWRSMDWVPQAPSLERMSAWRLYIRDGGGSEFLASQGTGAVPSRLPWNGRDNKGLALPDGKVQARWEADYAGGLHAKSPYASVELDSTPPRLGLDANPKVLRPNKAGAVLIPASFTAQAWDIHGIGAWKMQIKDEKGLPFKSWQGAGAPPPVIVWDGSNSSGGWAETGRVYVTTLTACDKLGNCAESAPNSQVVLMREIHLTLASDTLFETGKADVRVTAYQVIKDVAKVIMDHADLGSTVTIQGHTDNVPIRYAAFKDNQQLSEARAAAVVKFLVDLLGVPKEYLRSEGFGDTRPVASNDTPEGKQANRRVEIVIHTREYQ
jgi:outer membrane protein OmpA-like peptidoglycan-associated protein